MSMFFSIRPLKKIFFEGFNKNIRRTKRAYAVGDLKLSLVPVCQCLELSVPVQHCEFTLCMADHIPGSNMNPGRQ
jgi:hypothetical protein